MTARRISALVAALALASFAVAIVAAARSDHTPSFAAAPELAIQEPAAEQQSDVTVVDSGSVSGVAEAEVTVEDAVTVDTTARDTRVVPTPDGPVEPEAGPAGMSELVLAPEDAILYRQGCGTWAAVDRNGGRTYAAEGLDAACDAGWTDDGGLVAVIPGPPADRVDLLGREGLPTASVMVPGTVQTPVATGPRGIVFCVVADGEPTLYTLRAGDPAATPFSPGCVPAVNRLGHLAWAANTGGTTTSVLRTADLGPNVVGGVRLADFRESDVLALAWTGDGQRLVAVVRGPRRTQVVAIAPGELRTLLTVRRGVAVHVHPSPDDGRVVLASGPRGGAAVVSLVDAVTGDEAWQRRAERMPDVDWSPYGDEVLLSDRDRWRFVSAQSGRMRQELDAPGVAPAWCCRFTGSRDVDTVEG